MRRRLGLARLMLRPPTVLLLDEPYASFDADGVAAVNGFATGVAAGGGVVMLATHDMTRCADIVTRRVHVAGGRLADVAIAPHDTSLHLEVMS
jgi:ABC-type transport system involved in cytochrome c biogenesis ATPase subunit